MPPNAELTARWRATFERHGWKMPSGREVFIIAFEDQLAAGTKRPEDPHEYLAKRPLPGFLGYAIVTPMALFTSDSFRFVGYTGNIDQI